MRTKNKGQVTIFIIISILVIAVILLILILRGGNLPGIGEKPEKNVETFLDTCMKDKLQEAVDILESQGGYIEPELYRKFKFSDESYYNISYLCYNNNYYKPCINQEPMLLNHLKEEIKNYIKNDVRNCFTYLGQSLEDQGYVVNAKYTDFEVRFDERRVIIDINAEIILTKSGETSKELEFRANIPSRLYSLAKIAQEIVSQEARFCSFNNLGYMLIYPEWKINKFKTGDSTILYTIEHKGTGEKFRFAVRGCVIPPGF